MLAALGCLIPAFASADPQGEATFYKEGLRASAFVRNLTPGPDGNVWFVDSAAASAGIPGFGRISPTGEIVEYISGTNLSGLNSGSEPNAIVAGPGGSKYLWFTDGGTTPAIGRVDTASPETAVEFSIQGKGGNAASKPVGIAVGPEGNLWFADKGAEVGGTPAIGVAVLNAEKNEIVEVKEFSTGLNSGSKPLGIVAGADGNLWFTDQGATRAVGKIDPSSHAIEEFATGVNSEPGGSVPDVGPYGIVSGPDGNVWFTEPGTNEVNGQGVCRVLTSGEVGKLSCFGEGLITSSKPTGLTVAPGGRLWFTDGSGVEERQELEISDTEESTLGGTYKLVFEGQETGGTGSGNLLSAAKGKGDVKRFTSTSCPRVKDSKELKCTVAPTAAEVGMRIEGTGIPTTEPFTTIEKIEGNTIVLSRVATSSSSAEVKAGRIINISTESGKFETGQTVTGTGIPASTLIAATGEESGKGTLVPSKAPTAAGTGVTLTVNSTTLVTGVSTSTGAFTKGELIKGTGVPAGATITAINSNLKTLTLSAAATAAGSEVALSADLAYNASSTAVKEALVSLPAIGAGGASSTETGAFPVKRTIVFIGAHKDADVPQVTCNGSGLTGTSPSCAVITTVQGVPDAVGCITTAGKSCGRYPFAELYGHPSGLVYMPGENVWLGSGISTSATLGKVGVEPEGDNLLPLTVTKSANGPGGTGTVASKPKGIKCGTTCESAVGSFYKTGQVSSKVELTAKPTLTSTFTKWEGGDCEGVTAVTCTVTMDEEEEVKAVFAGTAKTITPTEALTVSKGESSGKGTVKASGLACEADCTSTVSLYQGPVVTPKVKPGKTVALTQAAAPGSEFTGWSGACSGTGVCEVEMSEAKEVVAEFEALPAKALSVTKNANGPGGTGTVASKPKGIKCGTTCSSADATFWEGAKVELTAKPTLTSTFTKWEGGDCEGITATTCTVTLNQDEEVKAVFAGTTKTITPTEALTVSKGGDGLGTVKASGLACEVLCSATTALYQGPVVTPKAKPGKTVALTAAAAVGSEFVEWTGACSGSGACEVEMSEAKEVVAVFNEVQ